MAGLMISTKRWGPVAGFLFCLVVVGLVGSCGSDPPSTPQNTPPTASFTVSPSSGTTDTLFAFDASECTDAQDAPSALMVRWDWEDDGVWDTGYTTDKTATHRYGTSGTKTIRLEVKDTGDLMGQTTGSVTVGSSPDGMVLIPAGTFIMGSDPGEGYEDERPEHQPYISGFFIDLYEVTNARYADALNWAIANGQAYWNGSDVVKSSSDGTLYLEVSAPDCRIDRSGSVFVVESAYEDHPVVRVLWYGAAAYCNWRSERDGLTSCYDTSTWECNFSVGGYRLPTEAEWEKGARGPSDERTYPWGDEVPDCGRVNYMFCVIGTTPVDSYQSGRSPYGLYDMAGNVWEWCNDWYDYVYYGSSPTTNPRGPSGGTYRVLRGGAWSSSENYLRCAYRDAYSPSSTLGMVIGFRCARSQ